MANGPLALSTGRAADLPLRPRTAGLGETGPTPTAPRGGPLALPNQDALAALGLRDQPSFQRDFLPLLIAGIGDALAAGFGVSQGPGALATTVGLQAQARTRRKEDALLALQLLQFQRSQNKDQIDAFGNIISGISKGIDAGLDRGALIANASKLAQENNLPFMIPLLSGAAEDPQFLKNLGPAYDLVKDRPGAQIFFAGSHVLGKAGSPEAERFRSNFMKYASSEATQILVERLTRNANSYRDLSHEQIAGVIGQDNPFLERVFRGTVPDMPKELQQTLDNALAKLGIQTPAAEAEVKKKQEAIRVEARTRVEPEVVAAETTREAAKAEALLPTKVKEAEALEPSRARVAAATGLAAVTAKEEGRRARLVPPDIRRLFKLPATVTIGQAEATGLAVPDETDPGRRAIKEAEVAMRTATTSIEEIQAIVKKTPQAFGVSGAVAKGLNAVRAQAENFARLSGIPVTASLDPKDYANTFRGVGIDNVQLQSQMISLAFAAAAMTGQTGRALSDRDIDLQLRRIATDVQDPVALLSVMDRLKTEFRERFAVQVESVYGRRPEAGPPAAGEGASVQEIRTMSKEALRRLDPRTLSPEQRKALGDRLTDLGF